MSVTVNLRYTGKNGNARKFAQEMISSGTVEKIRAEQGNLLLRSQAEKVDQTVTYWTLK